MNFGELIAQYGGPFFGFLARPLLRALPASVPPRVPVSPVRRAPACWPRTPPNFPSA